MYPSDIGAVDRVELCVSAAGAASTTTVYDRDGRATAVLVKNADGGVPRRLILTRDGFGRLESRVWEDRRKYYTVSPRTRSS